VLFLEFFDRLVDFFRRDRRVALFRGLSDEDAAGDVLDRRRAKLVVALAA
jgi:hypothetical protein